MVHPSFGTHTKGNDGSEFRYRNTVINNWIMFGCVFKCCRFAYSRKSKLLAFLRLLKVIFLKTVTKSARLSD